MSSCPRDMRLRALLDLSLPPGEEIVVRSHVDGCPRCHAQLTEMEPTWVFTAIQATTLAPVLWDDVMRSVRLEVASNPRRETVVSRALRWLSLPRLRPAAVAALASAMVIFSVALMQPVPTSIPVARVGHHVDADPLEFVYLSNPRAEVTHVLVTGDDGGRPVAVTMVVDASLAELF